MNKYINLSRSCFFVSSLCKLSLKMLSKNTVYVFQPLSMTAINIQICHIFD